LLFFSFLTIFVFANENHTEKPIHSRASFINYICLTCRRIHYWLQTAAVRRRRVIVVRVSQIKSRPFEACVVHYELRSSTSGTRRQTSPLRPSWCRIDRRQWSFPQLIQRDVVEPTADAWIVMRGIDRSSRENTEICITFRRSWPMKQRSGPPRLQLLQQSHISGSTDLTVTMW